MPLSGRSIDLPNSNCLGPQRLNYWSLGSSFALVVVRLDGDGGPASEEPYGE
jgi:hypothetical protein